MTVVSWFGVPGAGPGGCCGKPVGCSIQSKGCLHKVEKRAWQAKAAALPTCVTCGMAEQATPHVIAAGSGWSWQGMTPHPFVDTIHVGTDA